jgi:hypothetical protein
MPSDDPPPHVLHGMGGRPMVPREAAWRGLPVPVDYEEHAASLSRRWRIAGVVLLLLSAALAVTMVVGITAGAGDGEPFALVLAIVSLLIVVAASAFLLRIGRRGERLYGSKLAP